MKLATLAAIASTGFAVGAHAEKSQAEQDADLMVSCDISSDALIATFAWTTDRSDAAVKWERDHAMKYDCDAAIAERDREAEANMAAIERDESDIRSIENAQQMQRDRDVNTLIQNDLACVYGQPQCR